MEIINARWRTFREESVCIIPDIFMEVCSKRFCFAFVHQGHAPVNVITVLLRKLLHPLFQFLKNPGSLIAAPEEGTLQLVGSNEEFYRKRRNSFDGFLLSFWSLSVTTSEWE